MLVIIFINLKQYLNNYVFALLQLNAQLILTGVNKHKDKVGPELLGCYFGSSCSFCKSPGKVITQ